MNMADLTERVASEHGVAKEHAKKISDSAKATDPVHFECRGVLASNDYSVSIPAHVVA